MADLKKRIAVVTGANKGIGFEICRQLARKGIVVVLTSRDEKRGLEAAGELARDAPHSAIVFHLLDVSDSGSVRRLADFIESKFGKLDIVVNNAGISSAIYDVDSVSYAIKGALGVIEATNTDWIEKITETYDLCVQCLETNYRGAKRVAEALLPLLRLSESPRIVNVSSELGLLKNIPNERIKLALRDAKNVVTIDSVIDEFISDFKEGVLKDKGWPQVFSAYCVSKAALNAYTRILALENLSFRINCVCPGYVKTDITMNTGMLTPDEGARSPVRLALLPDDGPTGQFFVNDEVNSF